MTITTNAGFDSAAATPAPGVISLVELEFASGTLNLTNWPTDIVVGATTYTGVGLGQVGELKESEDGATQSVDLKLSQVNAAYLSLALGNVSEYQGRAVRIRQALTDTNLVISGTPVLRFAGWMNVVSVKPGEGGKGAVVLKCSTGGYDLGRNPASFRMNDAQHQSRHPGELGFAYVSDLIGKPALWLSKRFQQV